MQSQEKQKWQRSWGAFCCFWYRDGNYSRRCCFVFKFELCNQPVQLKGRRLTSCQQFRARAFCKALRAKEASAERLTPLVRFGEVMQADSFRRTPHPAKSARIKKEKCKAIAAATSRLSDGPSTMTGNIKGWNTFKTTTSCFWI